VSLIKYGQAVTLTLSDYSTDGQAASISWAGEGQLARFFVAEGSYLHDSSLTPSADSKFTEVLVDQLPVGATFEATYDGSSLTVSGQNLSQFVVYAPQPITTLTLQTTDSNNQVTAQEITANGFVQVGDYLYFNVQAPQPNPPPEPTPTSQPNPPPEPTPTPEPEPTPTPEPDTPPVNDKFTVYLPYVSVAARNSTD
jgi:hypothetical protein